jgi:hypothetical protein
MPVEDQEVLEFLGRQGKSLEAISERFPGFDTRRLTRAGLVEEQRVDLAETQAHMSPQVIRHYVLMERGARAVGIEPQRLDFA